MADLTYDIDINSNPALQSLKRLETAVGNLDRKISNVKTKGIDNINRSAQAATGSFKGLGAVIAGLGLGAIITQTIQYADGLNDLSDATDISMETLIQFSDAVTMAGGNAEKAQAGILKLTEAIGDAAGGSQKTRDAFAKVGVSLRDLEFLSEEDILKKTIDGIAAIPDKATRAAIATELLGKAGKGLNFDRVAKDMSVYSAEAQKAAQNAKAAADMQEQFDIATKKLRTAILEALKPMADFINKMSPEQINQFVQAMVNIGTAAAGIYTVTQAVKGLGSMFGWATALFASLYAMFGRGLAQASAGWASMTRTIGIAIDYVSRFFRATPQFAKANGLINNLITLFAKLAERVGYARLAVVMMTAGLVRMIPYIGAIISGIMILSEGLRLFTGKGIIDWAEQLAGKLTVLINEKFPKLGAALAVISSLQRKLFGDDKKPGQMQLPEGVKPSGVQGGRGDAQAELAQRQKDAVENLKKQQQERQRILEQTDKELAEQKRLAEEAKKFAEEMAKRRKDIEDTVVAFKNQSDATLAQIALEQELIGKSEDYKAVRRAVADVDAKAKSEVDKLIEARDQLTDKEKELVPVYNEQIAKIQQQAEIDKQRIAQATQGLENVKFLEEARTREIENQTAAIEAQIQRQQQLGDAIRSANDKMRETEFAGQQQKRSPLEQQIAQIQENARLAALEAGRSFAAGFEGMDLTADQAQELANGLDQIAQRYKAIAEEQTKQLEYSRSWEAGWKNAFDNYMDNATNASKTAGEVFNSITKNMESAIDNFVETGKFSFKDFARSIIQDLIKIELKAQATKILGALGGSGGIFSAIGSLFGFANGGTPPLNKPSIVGENGPELFIPKALGTVVPGKDLKMSGAGGGIINNNTYVTNNISAVDAKSVAQLFAENRKTLLGTVEMARKEMPYGR